MQENRPNLFYLCVLLSYWLRDKRKLLLDPPTTFPRTSQGPPSENKIDIHRGEIEETGI